MKRKMVCHVYIDVDDDDDSSVNEVSGALFFALAQDKMRAFPYKVVDVDAEVEDDA